MMDWLREHWEPLGSYVGGIVSAFVLLWRRHVDHLREVDKRYDGLLDEVRLLRVEQAKGLADVRVQVLKAIRDERESVDRDIDALRQRIDNLR
jgi:hypothetical protein